MQHTYYSILILGCSVLYLGISMLTIKYVLEQEQKERLLFLASIIFEFIVKSGGQIFLSFPPHSSAFFSMAADPARW